MNLVLIPEGKFKMGSTNNEAERANDEGPQREVTISKPFYMGIYEVTQEQYEAVMGNNPSKFKVASNPVEKVSWEDSVEFCKKLSQKTGKIIKLPTEAQWEYACRANAQTIFYFGGDNASLGDYAWYDKNSGKSTHPVGQKKPNSFGLYDMLGNVWEWCSDWYVDSYANASTKDPSGPNRGIYRVLRGGCYANDAMNFRSAYRFKLSPGDWAQSIGFRVVLENEGNADKPESFWSGTKTPSPTVIHLLDGQTKNINLLAEPRVIFQLPAGKHYFTLSTNSAEQIRLKFAATVFRIDQNNPLKLVVEFRDFGQLKEARIIQGHIDVIEKVDGPTDKLTFVNRTDAKILNLSLTLSLTQFQ